MNLGHQVGVALFGGKHVLLRIQLLFGITALFVRIELLCSSVRRLPPNKANGVAVFEENPIRYNKALLCRIRLRSNTAIHLALFIRIEQLCFVQTIAPLRTRLLLYKF